MKTSMSPKLGVGSAFDLSQVRTDTWTKKYSFVGEPIFTPRPGGVSEDDGWVMSVVYQGDEKRSNLVILDARDLSKGPVATIRLPHHIPIGKPKPLPSMPGMHSVQILSYGAGLGD